MTDNMKRNYNKFCKELEILINKHSMENGSNTPDYVLAAYLTKCLVIFDETENHRSDHYGLSFSNGKIDIL